MAAELRERGFGLLLAHPERSRGILDGGLRPLEFEIARGALVAANVDPLQGGEGPERRAAAEHILRRGMPDRRRHRRPRAAAAVHAGDGPRRRRARHRPAPTSRRRLTEDAPARLLAEGFAQDRHAA